MRHAVPDLLPVLLLVLPQMRINYRSSGGLGGFKISNYR